MQKVYKHKSDGLKRTSICKWLPLYLSQYMEQLKTAKYMTKLLKL